MSDPLGSRLREMREAFDRSFALPIEVTAAVGEHFLAIRVGDNPLALRVHDLQAIAHITRIVPIPGPLPEFLGLVGRRGDLVPVYDLGALLAYPRTGTAPRWHVQVGQEYPLGLAFDRMEGHRIADRQEAITDSAAASGGRHLAVMVRLEGIFRPVVDLKGLVDSLQRRLQLVRQGKE